MGRHNSPRENTSKVQKLVEQLNDIDPVYVEQAKQEGWDVERAWQLYAQFTGDVERTAHALGVKPSQILDVATRFHWQEKLKPIIELKQSGKPGDLERGISRAMNFVQAHRLRIVLQRMLDKFYSMPDEELFEACFTSQRDRDGNVVGKIVNTKPFCDLAAAMEKVQNMTYAALSDTATERAKREETKSEADSVSASQLHQIISESMSKASLLPALAATTDSQS